MPACYFGSRSGVFYFKNKKVFIKMNNQTKTIVDVRSTGEFMAGHVAGSINIPLKQDSGQH